MTCKKSYTKIIQRRLRLLWLALAGMLVFMVVIGELGLRSSKVITGFAYNCGNFLYWCGLFCIIGRIIINKKLLKDRLRMKEQQFRERDEYLQHLHRISGGWVMDGFLVIGWIAAIVTSCCSNEAFYAAYGLLLIAALLKGSAYLAYSKGWFKE